MRCYGLPLLTVNWVMDFLKSRKQRVMIDGQFSDWSMCTSGVPQGSVLGPLLYTLYVNDLPDVVKHAVVKMYADDTKLYYPVNNINDFYLLQSDLNAIAKWSEIWQLKLNKKKSVVLRLKDVGIDRCYTVKDVELKYVDHVKDLGVYISKNLDFSYHCNHVVNSAYNKIHLILHSFVSRDPEFMSKLFTTYVRPTLEYGSQVWSPFLLKNIDLVENVQRYFSRCIPGLSTLSYPDRLAFLKLPSLELRCIRSDCITLHKVLYNQVHVSFNNFFTLRSVVSQRILPRNNDITLFIPRAHLDLCKYSFTIRATNYWNALSNDIISISSVTNFAYRLSNENLSVFVRGRTLHGP